MKVTRARCSIPLARRKLKSVSTSNLCGLCAVADRRVPSHGVKTAPWVDDRLFFLCWDDRGDDWLLVEDEETAESSRLDASVSPGVGK